MRSRAEYWGTKEARARWESDVLQGAYMAATGEHGGTRVDCAPWTGPRRRYSSLTIILNGELLSPLPPPRIDWHADA